MSGLSGVEFWAAQLIEAEAEVARCYARLDDLIAEEDECRHQLRNAEFAAAEAEDPT